MRRLLIALAALMAYIGTMASAHPLCICIFYSPKKPAALK